MSRDSAVLFSPTFESPSKLILDVLPLLRSVGAVYRGVVTQLSFSDSEKFWRFSMISQEAETWDAVAAVLDSWEGLALELDSKFGPLMFMVWKDRQPRQCGYGLFETSQVFTAQAEDPDVREIFDSIYIDAANKTGSEVFALVGDPAIGCISRDAVLRSISGAPQFVSDPVVYSAGMRIEGDACPEGARVGAEWIQERKDGFMLFRVPDFGTSVDD